MLEVTRRQGLLLAAGAVASLAGARSQPALAQLALTAQGTLTTLSDGQLILPLNVSFPDVPRDELLALLEANGLPTDFIRTDCNVTLLRGEDRLVVFDVGAGPVFLDSTGRLMDRFDEEGIDPAVVTDVIITHAHPDHLWGVTDDFDELVFPNATFHIGQAEWDFWNAEDTLSRVPESQQSFVIGAQNRFAAIEDRVVFTRPGDEVLPGIEAVDTGGHTPGHLSFLIQGESPVMVLGDALANHIVSIQRPDWAAGLDYDGERAVATRRSLLEKLATEGTPVIGYHFPYPGFGRIERDGQSYRYVPA